jgi:exodeoxyribonuclease VII small subunit
VKQGSGQPEEPVVTFEDALARLEAVVAGLEQGEMTLAESLEAFREGIKNLSICVGRLDAFEEQVEVLLSEYYASAPSWLGGADPGGRPR